ncbi:hypothetical protein FSP39_022153 [Pinctada imbricata]|uniref:B box-type domain-containing protein n=1 Tax=Pinctada imbricata TaxID=66713 RepID=A0AA89BL04_PINIB|nr:hypothetical protein FSP39_022153 [Pinctada imbricata]
MALSKSVNLAHAQRAVPCNICEDEVPGEYYCIECKQTLCSQCEKSHKRVAATKNHNIVLRTQVGDIDTTTLTCTDHGDPASCHCEKCNIPVCIKCVTGKHKGHDMSDIFDVLEKEKKLLQDDIKAMQRDLPTLKSHRGEVLTKKENYKKEINKILKDMEDENQAVVKHINKLYKERRDDILCIQDSNLAVFDGVEVEMKTKIISYEKRISEYTDTISKNSLVALRNVVKQKKSLSEIGSKPELPDPPTFVPCNLESIVENLGKLHITASPLKFIPRKQYTSSSSLKSKALKVTTPTIVSKFKCPLLGSPRICITKEGDVWLGGSGSRELVMVDIKGQVLRRRNIQNRPYSLAVMDCGDVIISPDSGDSRSVSRLMRDGREQHVFDTSPSYSDGVSVTAEQKILMCTLDGRVVKTNGDGTNVKQIYKGRDDYSALHAVEDADGNIYISGGANQAVVKINKDGKVLSTITHTTGGRQLGPPWGLVVDKMDNILCADSANYCVYIIDQNQKMRELVGRSHGIQRPIWLAVDNDNNLWITQYYGNVHVVKYLSQ